MSRRSGVTWVVRVGVIILAAGLAFLAVRGAVKLVDHLRGSNDADSVSAISSTDTQTCPPADGTTDRKTQFGVAPPMCIDGTKRYEAIITTNLGAMTFSLDPSLAPKTVNNFVFLIRNHFYDGIRFHRIIKDFVAQAGDAGDGVGVGYNIPDELPGEGMYRVGSLAMANAGPDLNSSQFFIVAGDAGAKLPPKYSLFGALIKGFDVLDHINQLGTQSGTPTSTVVINSATVVAS